MKKNIEDVRFYYDLFALKIVLKKDEFAAPERYYEIGKTSADDLYADTWEFENQRLTYNYTKTELEKVGWHNIIAYHLDNKIGSARLILRRFPPKEFIKMISGYFKIENNKIEVLDNE